MGRRGSSAVRGYHAGMFVRPLRPLVVGLAAVGLLAASLAACGSETAPTPSAAAGTPAGSSAPTAAPTELQPDPTPVPVPDTPAPTEEPEPVPTQAGVTDTPWGAIVDEVPAEWPVFPAAEPVESDEGPASGAWLAPDDADAVAGWYRATLEERGFTTDNLSSPLEDGTRILDIVTDLPECRIQVTFRPLDGSTMITVLYGAGCAGGDA